MSSPAIVVYLHDYGACFEHHSELCEDCDFDAKSRTVEYSTSDYGFDHETGYWQRGRPAYHLVPIGDGPTELQVATDEIARLKGLIDNHIKRERG